MTKRKTAGALTLEAASDQTKYNAREVGQHLADDGSIEKNLYECAIHHSKIFNEDEFCVGFVITSDPLIKGIMRRKFFAMLYLPSPRPEQAVFLYNKTLAAFTKRLWILPAAFSGNPQAWTMERLYQTAVVPKQYQTMKDWTQAFYDGVFWPFIRKQHGIDMLSEIEYLNTHREELIEAGAKEMPPGVAEAFDFSKINSPKIVDTSEPLLA